MACTPNRANAARHKSCTLLPWPPRKNTYQACNKASHIDAKSNAKRMRSTMPIADRPPKADRRETRRALTTRMTNPRHIADASDTLSPSRLGRKHRSPSQRDAREPKSTPPRSTGNCLCLCTPPPARPFSAVHGSAVRCAAIAELTEVALTLGPPATNATQSHHTAQSMAMAAVAALGELDRLQVHRGLSAGSTAPPPHRAKHPDSLPCGPPREDDERMQPAASTMAPVACGI